MTILKLGFGSILMSPLMESIFPFDEFFSKKCRQSYFKLLQVGTEQNAVQWHRNVFEDIWDKKSSVLNLVGTIFTDTESPYIPAPLYYAT